MTSSARPTLLSLLALLACALPACNGGEGGGEGGSAGAGNTNTTNTTDSTSNGGAGGTPSTGGSDGGNSAGGSSTGGNASGGSSTGGSATGGSSTGGNGSGGSSGQVVECDNLSCALPGMICCQNYNEPAACIAPGGDCTYGVDLACDGPEDCASGEVCCATLYTQGVGNAYVSVACATTCTGKDFRVVCGASGDCPAGKTCGTSDILPPYLDCK